MKAFLVAPEAERDLQQIWRYLLREAGLGIANRIQMDLVDAFEGLAKVPGKGHKTDRSHKPASVGPQLVGQGQAPFRLP